MRRGGSSAKTQLGADAGAESCASCAADRGVVWLPAEQHPTLGVDGEITPDANPWAAWWMADLRELEPYDEGGVVQRMGSDVRTLLLDRELTAVLVAMDVTILRLRSLSVQVPPWGFQEVAGPPTEHSEDGGAAMAVLF